MKNFWIGLAAILFSTQGFSGELRSTGETIQGFGMGGVRIFDGYQASVFFRNPAGLNLMKGLRLDLLSISAGGNAAQSASKFTSLGTPTTYSAYNAIYGTPLHADVGAGFALAVPHFGVGVFGDSYADAQVVNPVLPEIDLDAKLDYGAFLGTGFSIGGVSYGISAKRITRRSGTLTLTTDQLLNLDTTTLASRFTNQGYGYGFDLGMIYEPGGPLNTQIGLGWQDVGYTTFLKTAGTEAPPTIRDNMTASVTFHSDAVVAGLSGGFEYRHINNSSEQIGKKLHMGLELQLFNMDLRTGLYQGYPTYGIGYDLFFLELNAAYYTVETGVYPGQTPDQRIQIEVSSSFGIDLLSLSASELNRKGRRHMKQRR